MRLKQGRTTDMWTKLDSSEMSWLERKWMDLRWRWSSFCRHFPNVKKYMHLRRQTKKMNKRLLAEAQFLKHQPMHKPPTQEEVQEFMEWAQNSGIRFENRVQPLPVHPLNSSEVDLTKTGI